MHPWLFASLCTQGTEWKCLEVWASRKKLSPYWPKLLGQSIPQLSKDYSKACSHHLQSLPPDWASVSWDGNDLDNVLLMSTLPVSPLHSWVHHPNKPFALECLSLGLLLGKPSSDKSILGTGMPAHRAWTSLWFLLWTQRCWNQINNLSVVHFADPTWRLRLPDQILGNTLTQLSRALHTLLVVSVLYLGTSSEQLITTWVTGMVGCVLLVF